MSHVKGKTNRFYVIAGILFLLSGILMPQHAINNPLMAAFGAAIGVIIIVMGFSPKRAVNYVALLFGCFISLIGTFGVYYSINHPETNSGADLLSAFTFAGSGGLLLIGAIIVLLKKKRSDVEFDFMRQ